MELNSLSGILAELKEVYGKQKSHFRGLDIFALFGIMVALIQLVYSGLTHGYPFCSMVSAVCMSLGFTVLVISLRLHLTPEIESSISNYRAFAEYIVALSLLFLFGWNFMN
ncbi:hypothetical protein TVAG_380410 [Trichomonas vaginalis G3]|uniref:Dolichyl-diphosphooligosaccharide--protein glycosyltransferase subunit OST2 n=1 Tax=Trichomonas vaginalis (strain ATCC PRA-98 / G3) TaxID=412133 RepID=A2DXH9_TRIV3|nr:DAD family [Trichomonas vaginalis G3]EAY14931.1 hypothetical protein TVAG_380410 [Trichomonas vaginalis G3]KAI5485403.1 DAD family [Trichomonas vaginalis G3]|eukprot:XP_001327154.1 hypothetical protein [Trichomonas vaginalis G3]